MQSDKSDTDSCIRYSRSTALVSGSILLGISFFYSARKISALNAHSRFTAMTKNLEGGDRDKSKS